MKLSTILANLDRSTAYGYCNNLDSLLEPLNISEFDLVEDHNLQYEIEQIPINVWRCTDITVGFFAYFYEGNPIAISTQVARKADVHVRWLNTSESIKVQEYILSLRDNRVITIDPEDDLEWVDSWFEYTHQN